MSFAKILLAAFLSPLAARADGLTLEAARKAALDRNPELAALKAETEAASWQSLKEISGHLPKLTLSGRHLFNEKFEELELEFNGANFVMPAIQPYSLLAVNLSLNVFDGGATWNRYRAARSESEAKDLELRRESFRLENEVRSLYSKALGAQALLDVADQNLRSLQQHLNDIQSQIRGGLATKYDALRFEVQIEEARAEKMAAEDNVVIARARLFEAIGLADDHLPLAGRLPESWERLDPATLQVDDSRDDLRAHALHEQSADRLSSASKGHWAPRIDLFGEQEWYNNMDHSINGDTKFKPASMVGVSFTWKLLDGGWDWAAQKQAAARSAAAKARLRQMRDHAPVDFELWRRRFDYSVANYKAKLVAIRKAEESVRLAQNGRRAGVRTNTDILDAEADLHRARAKAVQSQIDAVEALGQLELAVGHRLGQVQ